MGGGLMQLVAYGAQDIYLTGNPQITFFKVVYRRHTNFSMESISQTLDGNATIGTSQNETSCTISRNGDLIHKMYIVIPSANSTGLQFGSEIVQSAELEIGGQRIDYHTKEWNNVWNELTLTNNKALALKTMLSDNYKINIGNEQLIQSPLNFYFCKNPGLALPLIALQYHEVKINFVLGSTTNTHASSGTPIKFFVDYIYLDTDERRRFAQVSHEYLIEQVQMQTMSSDVVQELNFNHPVKELIWVTDKNYNYSTALLKLNGHDRFEKQEEEYFQLRQPFDYHTHIPKQNLSLASRLNHSYIFSINHLLKVSDLVFDIFTTSRAETIPSFEDSDGVIHPYYVTEFASGDAPAVANSTPKRPNTSDNAIGTSNDMSALTSSQVSYVFDTNDVHDFKVNSEYLIVFDDTFHARLSALINIEHHEDFGFLKNSFITQSVTCTEFTESSGGANANYRFVKFNKRLENLHSLYIENSGGDPGGVISFELGGLSEDELDKYISIPRRDLLMRSAIRKATENHPKSFLKIVDIIEISKGGNLDLARSSQLDKRINVYSFALKPEEHQPSGTCNFSRIDSATLEFGSSPTGSNGHIYAVNYNVLRIMSGMGGLAYSN
jgi:hypothetical protein